MEQKNRETYLLEVLSFVKFRYDHRVIRRELEEHKGGYNGIGWKNINEISPDAKELEIRYGDLRLWIDLETGEVRDNEKTKA